MLATFADLHVDSGARQVAARAQINAYLTALQSYQSEVGSFPTETQGLNALRNDPGVAGWSGPYINKDVGPDPWGHPYLYRFHSNGGLEILSLGADGKPGGEGIAADISSLELSKVDHKKTRTPAAYLARPCSCSGRSDSLVIHSFQAFCEE
jgi:general secretion pathway protein G